MPENAVYVGRRTKWGNPFRIGGVNADDCMTCSTPEEAVVKYRSELITFHGGFTGLTVEEVQRELRGKDLACWCPIGSACHADVLLELANVREGR